MREFCFELAFAPAGVTHERAHNRGLVFHDLHGLLDHEMMPAFQALRLFVPSEGGKNELIGGHRPAEENRHATERAEILAGQNLADETAGRTIQRQPERAFLRVVGGDQEDRFPKVGIEQTGVRDEQRASEADRR